MVSDSICIYWRTLHDIKVGEFPIVSLMLAFSFGIYGLLKKVVHIDAISSITVECIVTAPAGLCRYLWQQHQLSFGMNMSSFWLLFSGAITAIPLILFSAGKTYSIIFNRVHPICWTNHYVCFRYLLI